ncbi:MAG: hypothetical protein KBA66_14405 [Leptospiraceae bacterium]|nr:hypothetical protein [Leptospiraceae bacterium]
MNLSKKILLIGFLMFYSCADTNDLYYSIADANTKIMVAFAIKDAECNYTHTITAFIPGEARKREIDACVQSILTRICVDWIVEDPTPLLCKTINYRTNFKLRGRKL